MVLMLLTSYRYGGFLEFYFKLQFSVFFSVPALYMVKLCYKKMLILRCIDIDLPPPPKRMNHLQKKNEDTIP